MENTLLVALSRQVALSRELDVVANNMANVNTHGFRRESVQFAEYLMPTASADGFPAPDRRLSYVQDRASYHDFESGSLQQTGNPLDLAIRGDAFFAVQAPDGQGERYTRDGTFQIDTQGRLITANGQPVLGEAGPITLDPDNPTFDLARDGTISDKDGIRNRLRVVRFDNPQRLQRDGDGLFHAGAGQASEVLGPAAINVAQGMVETSNVKPILEMSRLIEINRAYTSLSSLIQRNDELRKTAVERLADLPA